MKIRTKETGNNCNDWETPDYLINYIRSRWAGLNKLYDPCPLKADFDGLSREWHKVNFINPPYTRKLKEAFIKKAYSESLHNKICIMLIPATTETKIFFSHILGKAEIYFIKSRVKFKGFNSKGIYTETGTGQTGSMLVVHGTGKKTIEGLKIIRN